MAAQWCEAGRSVDAVYLKASLMPVQNLTETFLIRYINRVVAV
jgi:hypothetical protein